MVLEGDNAMIMVARMRAFGSIVPRVLGITLVALLLAIGVASATVL